MRKYNAVLAVLTILVLLVACMPLTADAAKTYTGTITKDKIFFRSRPSTSSSWSTRFSKGTKVQISGVSGDFFKITYGKKTGYVMRKFVSISDADAIALGIAKTTTVANDPKMNGITKISQITVPATSKKGSTGNSVLAIQQALKIKGFYTAQINSKFDDNTVNAVKAYQKYGAFQHKRIKRVFLIKRSICPEIRILMDAKGKHRAHGRPDDMRIEYIRAW